jgi:hypothetical protein
VSTAACAVALATGLGALDATDAGASAKLAWVATVAAALLVVLGVLIRSSAPVHLAVALLGALLLLRHDARLLLAPVYGAGLLLVAELGSRSIELRGVGGVARGVQAARALAVVAVAAVGACASAGAAAAVTAAPARSVALTGVAVLGIVAIYGVIAWRTRRRYPTTGAHASPARGTGPRAERNGSGGS